MSVHVAGPASPKKRLLDSRKNVECIVLDIVKMSAATDKATADAWIKSVESVREAEQHKPLDLLLLFLLHGLGPGRKKAVESLARNKVQ